jgi:hypothetical protein
MKFLVSIFLIMLLSFAGGLYFPWWSIAISSFIVAAVIPLRLGIAFIAGFLGLFLLWGGLALWISSSNDNILAHRVSLLMIKSDSPYLLILVTAIIGALVGGFSSMTGSLLNSIIYKNKIRRDRL